MDVNRLVTVDASAAVPWIVRAQATASSDGLFQDGLRKLLRYLGNRLFDFNQVFFRTAIRPSACCNQHERIVSRRIAIDRDAVERPVGGPFRHGLEIFPRYGSVRRDEAEHGRHVGLDHAGALGDPGDGGLAL